MMINKRVLQALALMLSLFGGLSVGHAIWPDPEFDAGVYRIMQAGALAWRITSGTVNGNSALVISGASSGINSPGGVTAGLSSDIVIQPGGKGFGLPMLTNAQIAALTPAASGYLILNITKAKLCVSTGTGVGAYVVPSTGSTAGTDNATLSPCAN